ncbi:hypothetical protein [Blastomonas sp.]|uniref:hypothetical protein n=1 Tax=Blastomonas sp. TaxID=1909299 RepID=UPI00262AAE01|nr:hypothetical protein [Blastomonas sp.]MDM7958053.1 hypothetical protein [Blastomonas sp.]
MALGLVAFMAVLAGLTLSLAPNVPEPKVADATSAAAAHKVAEQITGEQTARGELVDILLGEHELDGLGALASEALSPLRVQARLQPAAAPADNDGPSRSDPQTDLIVEMSRELGWGFWLNAHAAIRPQDAADLPQSGDSIPDIALSLGRLPIPQALTRWALDRIWLQLQGDVARPLTLAQAVRRVRIADDEVTVVLINPGRGAALAGLARARGETADPGIVAAVYCAIADTGETDLAVLVRRAAALKPSGKTSLQDHNRALLAAIAMRAVPEYRDKLAGAALPEVAACAASDAPLTLMGRPDLAKHWALSAALAATLGSQVARSMGTWKELADSTGDGSGFSFVDLAADRSGERFAIAAVDPKLARAVHIRLGAMTEAQMLPGELLARPEGLDQTAFERDYTNVASPEYTAAVRTIDKLLSNAGVP